MALPEVEIIYQIYELMKKDVSEMQNRCGMTAAEAEMKIIAQIIENENLDGVDACEAASLSESASFSNVSNNLKSIILDAVKKAYIDEAKKIVSKKLGLS